MTFDRSERARQTSLDGKLRILLSGLAGLCLFGMGILYWSRLIGATGGEHWRFDTMPVWWRMAAPVLAVLYPVAGAGVWMLASWGTVIWILVFMVEIVMHVGFVELFGPDLPTIALHAAGLALLAGLRLSAFLGQRRRKS